MRDGKHDSLMVRQVEEDGVRVSIQHHEGNAVFVLRPHVCGSFQAVDSGYHRRPKSVCCHLASRPIPAEGLDELRLCIRSNSNNEGGHNKWIRARASLHALDAKPPARKASLLSSNSWRHASETEASGSLARLSTKAAATALRSSAGRSSKACRKWSTRAFMVQSVALSACHVLVAIPPNTSSLP